MRHKKGKDSDDNKTKNKDNDPPAKEGDNSKKDNTPTNVTEADDKTDSDKRKEKIDVCSLHCLRREEPFLA